MHYFLVQHHQGCDGGAAFDGHVVDVGQGAAVGDDPEVAADVAVHNDRREDAFHLEADLRQRRQGQRSQIVADGGEVAALAQGAQKARVGAALAQGIAARLVEGADVGAGERHEAAVLDADGLVNEAGEGVGQLLQVAAIQHQLRQHTLDCDGALQQGHVFLGDALVGAAGDIDKAQARGQFNQGKVVLARRPTQGFRRAFDAVADGKPHADGADVDEGLQPGELLLLVFRQEYCGDQNKFATI